MPISLGSNFTDTLSDQFDKSAGEGAGKGRKRIAPPGPQMMRVLDIQFHVAGDNNKANFDYITMVWENSAGQTCDDFISLSPKALWKFASRMQVVNLTASQPANMYITAFLGRFAEVVVEHEQNGNYTDANAQYVNKPEKVYDEKDPTDISMKENEYTMGGKPSAIEANDLPF